MKKALLVGYYGNGNFGDELMAASIISRLPRKEVDVSLMSFVWRNPTCQAQRFLGLECQVINFSGGGRVSRFTTIWKAVRESDAIIFGGGTLFFDNVERGFLNFYGVIRIVLIAWLLRKRICFYGVGLGELKTTIGRFFVKQIIMMSSNFSVRDSRSYARAIGIVRTAEKVVLGAEPCFLLDRRIMHSIVSQKGCHKTVSMCLMEFQHSSENRNDVPFSQHEFAREISFAIREILNALGSVKFKFVSFQEDVSGGTKNRSDTRMHRMILDSLPASKLYEVIETSGVDFVATLRVISESDVVVGMRYHSLVAATLLNKPVVALSITDKVESYMEDIGCGDACIDLRGGGLSSVCTELAASVIRGFGSQVNYDSLVHEQARQANVALCAALDAMRK